MSKQTIYLISFVLVLGVALTSAANADDPNLVGYWKLDDEGTGTVLDYSGNDRSGTLLGGARLVPGLLGDAVEITATGDRVEITDYPGVTGTQSRTVSAWIKTETTGEIVSWGENSAGQKWIFRVQTSNGNAGAIRVEVNGGYSVGDTDVRDGQWHHVAAVLVDDGSPDANEIMFYVDGGEEVISAELDEPINTAPSGVVRIGEAPWGYRSFVGLIDDVRIYDGALTQGEIKALSSPLTATRPDPADGAKNVANALLQWTGSDMAAFHDVYFGTNPVTGPDEFIARQTGTIYFDAAGLAPGTTYYWRIDEVEADGTTIHTGDVWTFAPVPSTAHSPDPGDGSRFVDPNADLGWGAGAGGITRDVYFGTNQSDVANGTGDTFKVNQPFKTYEPGTLERSTAYFWRIDEVEADGTTKHTGDVWSFRTRPAMPVRDPNLVGWWMFDDEGTGTVIDYSGHGRDGTFHGTADFAPGYDGDALMLRNDSTDYVTIDGYKGVLRISNNVQHAFTITAWIKTNDGAGEIVGWGNASGRQRVEFRLDGGRLRVEHGSGNKRGDTDVDDNQWHHVALVVPEGADMEDTIFYLDGVVEPQRTMSNPGNKFNLTSNFDVQIGRRYNTDGRLLHGLLDDVRIYDKVLTADEIKFVMLRHDPMRSWDPNPANGSVLDVEHLTSLSWSAGEQAAEHDVYLGTDKDAVIFADTSDTTGILYRGRQNLGNESYTPPEALEWGTGPYYWRIDEYNTDATISEGRIWSFTVADYLVVDDFEDYNDYPPDEIWATWVDGYGVLTNGSTVGYPDPDWDAGEHYVETMIVHGGDQSMPYFYDNDFKYSEATITLSPPQDWTRKDVKELSLWFRGYLESASTLTEDPSGTYTMTARSGDIWGTSDQLHYVFKQLTGVGSIVAKVESMTNTSNSAKGGVMIRETLDPDSKHAFTFMRPDGGVRFNRRIEVGATTTNSVENGLAFPRWVKLERDISGLFTASHSTDGINWVPVNDTNLGTSEIVNMDAVIYIGLALSSNNTGETCEAKFSNVSTTGTVTGQWQSQDIGILANDPEPMYVALSNSTGPDAVVYYDDVPNPTQLDTWTEWNIDLQEFANQGVNLTNVSKLAIGFGDKSNPGPGGSGTMFFDDIRLYRPPPPEPEPEPEPAP